MNFFQIASVVFWSAQLAGGMLAEANDYTRTLLAQGRDTPTRTQQPANARPLPPAQPTLNWMHLADEARRYNLRHVIYALQRTFIEIQEQGFEEFFSAGKAMENCHTQVIRNHYKAENDTSQEIPKDYRSVVANIWKNGTAENKQDVMMALDFILEVMKESSEMQHRFGPDKEEARFVVKQSVTPFWDGENLPKGFAKLPVDMDDDPPCLCTILSKCFRRFQGDAQRKEGTLEKFPKH